MGADNNCCQKRDNELEGMAMPGSRLRGHSLDARGNRANTGLAYLIREDNNNKRLRQEHINIMNHNIR